MTDKHNRTNKTQQNVKQKQPKKKQKGKGVGKGISNKRKNLLSESSKEEEDAECLFCTETFSKDDRGEGWIKCCVCQRWGHEACAGIDSDDSDKFTCLDWCKITPGKRHLEL
ncbi:unnamed protein product [Euphydryas editha]|uniref:Zinc finger PHD-type domain-containing protein n=1 Tax=Euphydryas editha TaxID=104508 RepID=A0AAU9UHI2_EUPED|nr:unnamed protein product [Euphydryas editha]